MMRRLLHWLAWLENTVVVVLLVAMLVLSVVQVVLRNVLDSGIDWVQPFQQYALLWLGFVGASIATRENKHISIDVVVMLLPKRQRRWLVWLPGVFAAVVCGVAAWCCWLLLVYEKEAGDMAFGVVPLWLCLTIMPLSFAVMALRALASAFHSQETGFSPVNLVTLKRDD